MTATTAARAYTRRGWRSSADANSGGKLTPVLNESAPPSKQLKYARRERERRFLLRSLPDRPAERTVLIEDRYLPSTRLRLRRATETTASGDRTERTMYKLTQKVPGPDGGPGLITTMYIDAAEYAALSQLPAAILRKTRLSIPPLGVDVFGDPLRALVMAEAEFGDDASMSEFVPPLSVVAEVTRDQRLSGGRLATMTATELAAVLREYDVPDKSQCASHSGAGEGTPGTAKSRAPRSSEKAANGPTTAGIA